MSTNSEPLEFGQYHVPRRADGTLWELGRGAMGVTYRAFDTKLKIEVVLKLIHPDVLQSERMKRLFLREARSAAKVRHPNIAAVINLHDEDPYYYAMEFVAGSLLGDVLKARGTPLPVAEALDYADQIAAALSVMAREHIVHRDLKPSNLMLLPDEEQRFGQLVKVIDFGLARGFSAEGENVETYLASSISQSGVFSGTPYYASPEQCGTTEELDTRSDLYSLGIILWEMLCGKRPFTGGLGQVLAMHQFKAPPVEQLAGVPAPVVDLLLKLLAKERDDRFQTPRELRTALGACAASLADGAFHSLGGSVAASAAPGTESIRLGTTLAQRFQLGSELAEGDGGKLYRATDAAAEGRLFALKLLSPACGHDNALMVQLDAQFARMRAHPQAICLSASGGIMRSGASAFFVREWADGFSLLELLAARGELRAPEVRRLLAELPAAIDHAVSHAFTFAEPLLRKLFVVPPANAPAGSDWPSLRSRPIEDWPAFCLRWNAVSFRPEGAPAVSVTQTAGETPSAVEEPVVALAVLVRELLGGRAGSHAPLSALGDEANATLRRALGPGGGRTAFAGASALWEALLLAGGSAFLFPSGAGAPRTASESAPLSGSALPVPPAAGPRAPSRAPLIAAGAVAVGLLAVGGWWWRGSGGADPAAARAGTPATQTTPARSSSIQDRAAVIVADGDRLSAAGKWEEAAGRYTAALTLDRRSRDAYVGRGYALGRRREFVAAINDFDEAIRLDPKYALAYARRGTIYAALQQDEAALQDCNEAIRLDPKLAEAYERRAFAYASLGQRDRAIADFDQAIRLNPQFAQAFSGRGVQLSIQRQKDRALADCNEGIRLDPESAGAYRSRAQAQANLGLKEPALRDFDEAIRRDPRLALAYFGRGNLYFSLGQRDKALQDYSEAIRVDPTYARAFTSRGTVYAALGQNERAIKDYDEAVRLDPKYAASFYNRGNAHVNLGQRERALKDYDETIRLDPKFTQAFCARGNALSELGQRDRALKDLDESIRLDPKYAPAYSGRGIVYANLGQHPRAIQDYNEAIRLDPQAASAFGNRGASYANLSQPERAVKDYDEALRLDPKLPWVRHNRGLAYATLKQFEKAVGDYDEAIRLNPKNPTYYENRSKAFRSLNQPASADRDAATAKELRAAPR